MNNQFRDRFCSGNTYNYALKSDFDFALGCIDQHVDKQETEQRIKDFKQSFIENFVPGSSFLSVSY
jgi:hypothetical protein